MEGGWVEIVRLKLATYVNLPHCFWGRGNIRSGMYDVSIGGARWRPRGVVILGDFVRFNKYRVYT